MGSCEMISLVLPDLLLILLVVTERATHGCVDILFLLYGVLVTI